MTQQRSSDRFDAAERGLPGTPAPDTLRSNGADVVVTDLGELAS